MAGPYGRSLPAPPPPPPHLGWSVLLIVAYLYKGIQSYLTGFNQSFTNDQWWLACFYGLSWHPYIFFDEMSCARFEIVFVL